MSWLWLTAAIVAEIVATLSLRASDGFRKKLWLIPIGIGYGSAFLFLALSLDAGMPVGIAYGIWTAVGIALVSILAKYLWQDPLTKRMLLGIAVIVVGVVLVEVGS